MKKHKIIGKAAALALSAVLCAGSLSIFAGCTKKSQSLVVMIDALNGLFNPFFATTGTDMDVVGQTQISMLSSDADGKPAYGDDEAVVVKDYKLEHKNGNSEYYFVLKNGIKFSDGKPLTMNDVMFNMYVYLDPAYTGSSTMYSTDIEGLQAYRTQQNASDATLDDEITKGANDKAEARRQELIDIFHDAGGSVGSTTYSADEAKMKAAIASWNASPGYINAIWTTKEQDGLAPETVRAQLLEDYENTLEEFRKELELDYVSAKDAYTEDPYKSHKEFKDEVLCFMCYEGFVKLEYELVQGVGQNKNNIVSIEPQYDNDRIKTEKQAIDFVYDSKVQDDFDQIVQYWATGTTMLTQYISKAKDVILHENLKDGEKPFKNISGVMSLGHLQAEDTTRYAAHHVDSVTISEKTYKVAQEHNEDGTPKNADEYDVLKIVVKGTDPKAIWNFGFSVAPHHYYSNPKDYPVNIANNEFGVDWASFDFMSKVLQGKDNGYGQSKNSIPMGAGPYVATDINDKDNPTKNEFYNDNTVYYKANEHFVMGAPKIKSFRYRYVSSSNALGNLQSGNVHFVEPQFTKENSQTIDSLKSKGIKSKATWQLGYGYVGVNAGKIADIYLRKSILTAMDTSLALMYYDAGTAVNIAWPMSVVSWAYPRKDGSGFDPNNPTANMEDINGSDYMPFMGVDAAKRKIQEYMAKAKYVESDLKITFTIAGSNMTEHPLYNTFIQAREILNSLGWDIEVKPDTNALIKLSTGSLSVWAAAWGSTIDPDMYQVYHKDSNATSVLSWGYREILTQRSKYSTEYKIISDMSEIIDAARETDDQAERTKLYKEAMGYVLDLAVEMPVYQRQTLYAYNSKVINEDTFPEKINSYSSPLSRIWELEFAK